MIVSEDKRAAAEANRRRYEALRAAGQEKKANPLPALTEIGGAPIDPASIVAAETIPGGWYTTLRLRRGEALRLLDETGTACAALIGWRADETAERINCADTVKVQWTASVRKGRVILTDMGHVFLSVIEDTSGAHDTLAGPSNAASVLAAFGREGVRNTRDNFVAGTSKLGLSRRDIPPCITFFAPVRVEASGTLAFDAGRKKPGDFVDLRAEMDLILIVSNAVHPLDPAPKETPGPITLTRFRAPVAGADDPCRTGSEEAGRAFLFTDRLFD